MSYVTIGENETSKTTTVVFFGIPVLLLAGSPFFPPVKHLFASVSIIGLITLALITLFAYLDYKDGVVRTEPKGWNSMRRSFFTGFIAFYYLAIFATCVLLGYTYLSIMWVLMLVFTDLFGHLIQITIK